MESFFFYRPSFYLFIFTSSIFVYVQQFFHPIFLFIFIHFTCMHAFFRFFFSFSCWTVDARRVHKRNILSEVPYTYTERQRKINEGWFH